MCTVAILSRKLLLPERRSYNVESFPVSEWIGFGDSTNMGGLLQSDVQELLASLVDKHLVVRDDASGRFYLLETVLAYGRAKLVEHGEVDSLRIKHRDHILALAEEAEPHFSTADQSAWLDRLEADHDNLRSALRWTIDRGDADVALRIAAAAGGLWFAHVHLSEGRKWLGEVLELPLADTPLKAAARGRAASFALWQADYAAAKPQYLEILRLGRELGDSTMIARGLNGLGCLAILVGDDLDEAEESFSEGLLVARDEGNLQAAANLLSNLGEVSRLRGNLELARRQYAEAIEIARSIGEELGMAHYAGSLGLLAFREGDLDLARQCFSESLHIALKIGDTYQAALAISGIAGIVSLCRNEMATELQGFVLAETERTGVPLQRFDQSHFDETKESLLSVIEKARYDELITAGRRLNAFEAAARAAELLEQWASNSNDNSSPAV